MKNWVKELISKGTAISSKRVTAILIAINLLIISYIAMFSVYQCPLPMFDTLALLSGSLFGGTIIEAFAKNKPNDSDKTN